MSAYLAKELYQSEMEEIREHLYKCPSCISELRNLEKLNEKMEHLKAVVPSPGFEANFWRKVKETRQREDSPSQIQNSGWTLWWKWGLSTAVVILLMFGGYIFWEELQNFKGQMKSDTSIEMAEIERDIEFFRNYKIIKDMDVLINLEKDEKIVEDGDGNSLKNHTL